MIQPSTRQPRSRPDAASIPAALLAAFCVLAAGCGRPVTVVVETEPAGATVWVGRQLAGPSPRTVTLHGAQPVQVRASHPSFLDAEVTLSAGDLPPDRRILLRLAPRPTFSIQCVAVPCEADVFLDGEYRGKTPLRIAGLEQSTVELIFRAPDREQVRRTVTLDPAQPNVLVEVALRSLVEPYYRQAIKDHPAVMANYVDLAHHLMLERRYADAMSVLADGIRLALERPGIEDIGRLWAEIDKITERQYVYGDLADLRPVRILLRDMLAAVLAESPRGEPQLFVRYAVVLDELGQRDECVQVMREAWKRFPGNDNLARLAKRKRLSLR
jgi:hypothetical protein